MKIAAVSDLHGFLPEIPECDYLIIAGDICGSSKLIAQKRFINNEFMSWLRKLNTRKNIVVAGNHDLIFQDAPYMIDNWPDNTVYLQDSGCEIDGLIVYGTPWQREFCNWAFNLPEKKLQYVWDNIPEDVDILVTHSPPYGYGDFNYEGEKLGSPSLTARIEKIQPKYHFFGHIHEGYGVYKCGCTICANVSLVDRFYQPCNKIMEFEL